MAKGGGSPLNLFSLPFKTKMKVKKNEQPSGKQLQGTKPLAFQAPFYASEANAQPTIFILCGSPLRPFEIYVIAKVQLMPLVDIPGSHV